MGGEMVRPADGADAGGKQPPRETSRSGGDLPVSLNGNGAADDIFLPNDPAVRVMVRIPPCPNPFRPLGDDTVYDAFLFSRRQEDDHVPALQLFDTAGDEHNPVARPEEGPHALAPAEDRAVGFLTRFTHADFNPRS